jgi:hypothetical protein
MESKVKVSINRTHTQKRKLKKISAGLLPVKRVLKKDILQHYDELYKHYIGIEKTELFAHEKTMSDLNMKYGENAVIRSFRKQQLRRQ